MIRPARSLKLTVIVCLVCITSACKNQAIPLETVYSSNNCAINNQLLKSINSADELDSLLKSFPRNFSNAPAISKVVDYRKQSLILFALGQKSSNGYVISLEQKEAIVKDKILYLPILIQQPDKNGFHAQMITSPCRIYSIPKISFTEIHIGTI